MSRRLVIAAGFSMFSMFFGSGNLIFPLELGATSGNYYPAAILGVMVTGVLVPFLGLLALILIEGDYHVFFKPLGKVVRPLLVGTMLCLMGPFAVIPRCVFVAFGGLTVAAPSFPFWIFSLIFCSLLGILAWNRHRIVDVIAYLLTPFKFGSLLFLIVAGFWIPSPATVIPTFFLPSFFQGMTQGYETMDLIGAFFFSCTIYDYIKERMPSKEGLVVQSLKASALGGGLLGAVYTGFVILGAKYAPVLHGVPAESILVTIAHEMLGNYGSPVVAFVLCISCLTTASILTTLFADFLHQDILRLPRPLCLGITLLIAFGISLAGFQTVRYYLGMILHTIYPLMILYTIGYIVHYVGVRLKNPKGTTLSESH